MVLHSSSVTGPLSTSALPEMGRFQLWTLRSPFWVTVMPGRPSASWSGSGVATALGAVVRLQMPIVRVEPRYSAPLVRPESTVIVTVAVAVSPVGSFTR